MTLFTNNNGKGANLTIDFNGESRVRQEEDATKADDINLCQIKVSFAPLPSAIGGRIAQKKGKYGYYS
jgi:hypothetical protein